MQPKLVTKQKIQRKKIKLNAHKNNLNPLQLFLRIQNTSIEYIYEHFYTQDV